MVIWDQNISALKISDSFLAHKLITGNPTGSLEINEDSYSISHAGKSIFIKDGSCPVPASEEIIVCGVGQGKLLNEILENDSVDKVCVVEENFLLILQALKTYDWSEDILSKRLQFLMIVNLTPEFFSINERQIIGKLQNMFTNPLWVDSGSACLHKKYYEYLKNILSAAKRKRDQLVEIKVSKKELLDVVVISPSCLIFNDLARAFNELGYKARILQIPSNHRDLPQDKRWEIYRFLKETPSRLVVTRNRVFFGDPNFGSAFVEEGESLTSGALANWWWDIPDVANEIDYQNDRGYVSTFGFARDVVNLLPSGASFLPPGALGQFVNCDLKELQESADFQVSFVGASRSALFLENMEILDRTFQTLGNQKIRLLKEAFPQCKSHAERWKLFASNFDELTDLVGHISHLWPHQGYYLNYLLQMCSTILFRWAGVEKIFQENIKIDIFGDDGWKDLGIVDPERFHGPINPMELSGIYQRSRVNLNLNFFQVSSTVNPKVLDVSACGGVVLTDDRPELAELYPDKNCRPYSFTELDELPDLVGDLLKENHQERQEAIRKYTCDNHTLTMRAQVLAERFLK